jgi:hypothetical protein
MSKFPLQISKALAYSKIKFYSKRNFSIIFGPAAVHLHFLSPTGRFFPPFPAGPRPLGPVGHALVAPSLLAASLTGRRLQPRRLCPSLRPADRWGPPVIPHLQLRLSSAAPPPPPATPRAAQLHTSGCRPEPLLAPPSLPLNSSPPLNLAPVFNCVNAINAAVTPRPPHPVAPPAPIKRR